MASESTMKFPSLVPITVRVSQQLQKRMSSKPGDIWYLVRNDPDIQKKKQYNAYYLPMWNGLKGRIT